MTNTGTTSTTIIRCSVQWVSRTTWTTTCSETVTTRKQKVKETVDWIWIWIYYCQRETVSRFRSRVRRQELRVTQMSHLSAAHLRLHMRMSCREARPSTIGSITLTKMANQASQALRYLIRLTQRRACSSIRTGSLISWMLAELSVVRRLERSARHRWSMTASLTIASTSSCWSRSLSCFSCQSTSR